MNCYILLVMMYRTSGKTGGLRFSYRGEEIKITGEFNYLGIKLMANGKGKRHIDDMVIKENRLMGMFLRSSITELDLNDIKVQKRILRES